MEFYLDEFFELNMKITIKNKAQILVTLNELFYSSPIFCAAKNSAITKVINNKKGAETDLENS